MMNRAQMKKQMGPDVRKLAEHVMPAIKKPMKPMPAKSMMPMKTTKRGR